MNREEREARREETMLQHVKGRAITTPSALPEDGALLDGNFSDKDLYQLYRETPVIDAGLVEMWMELRL